MQTPTPPVLGSKAGPVPKGRARREVPTLRAFWKLGEGSRCMGPMIGRKQLGMDPQQDPPRPPRTQGLHKHAETQTQVDRPTCTPVYPGILGYMGTHQDTNPDTH